MVSILRYVYWFFLVFEYRTRRIYTFVVCSVTGMLLLLLSDLLSDKYSMLFQIDLITWITVNPGQVKEINVCQETLGTYSTKKF